MPEIFFVRKNSFGVIRSLDGGTTWEYDTTGVGQNYETRSLFYDSVSDKVFLGIGWPKYKLYYQAPSDVNWTEVTNLPGGLNNFSPTQMTRKGSKLFVTDVYKRVLESSDNGITWIQKNGTGLGNADSQVGPGRFLAIGNDLYLGCGHVWKSTDDGDSWTAIDQGFPLQSGIYVDTRCLYYDGSKLYASTYTNRMTFESTDNGASWADFGGTGSWFFKAMTVHNGSLYGVIHSKDSIYIYGSGGGTNNPPAAPTNLTVSPQKTAGTDMMLNWIDNANNEDGFKVERSLDGTNWSIITDITIPDEITYLDAGLASDTKYYYRVMAYNSGGNSVYSNVAEGTTSSPSSIFSSGRENGIKIFPNPARDYLNITSLNGDLIQIEIFDSKGMCVFTRNNSLINQKENKINLSNLEQGVYFIRLIDKDQSIQEKLIISK